MEATIKAIICCPQNDRNCNSQLGLVCINDAVSKQIHASIIFVQNIIKLFVHRY